MADEYISAFTGEEIDEAVAAIIKKNIAPDLIQGSLEKAGYFIVIDENGKGALTNIIDGGTF